MINELIESISISINAEFTEKEYEIHMEEIKQDLKEPCFFIACLNPTNDLFLGRRYFRQNNFVIQYFPESGSIQRECNTVAERLNNCLEYITPRSEEMPIRGNGMKYEIIDGVLNFFVDYDLFVHKEEIVVLMGEMDSDTVVKEGE